MRRLVLALLLTSCSHVSTPRAPSSLPAAPMSATYEDILASPDPRAAARAFIDQLLRIELRAHGWMYEFDHALEGASGPVNILGDASYRKLLAARPLIERIQSKVVSLYMQAVENEESDARARAVVGGVHDALLHAHHNPAERVLLNDLMRELREARGKPGAPEPLERKELAEAAAVAGPAIQNLLDQLPETDELKEKVEEDASGFADASDRAPQSLAVFASAGVNGNIDGFTFPRGTWAITFDDGPHVSITGEDLANLEENNVKATFFWLAKNVELYPQVVKMVQDAGMPVEDHSWSHPALDKPSDLARLHTNLDREINQSYALDTKVYGARPRFFRCPYGAGFKNAVIRTMIAKLGMIHVRWNVDSLDWKDPNPVTVRARVEAQMRANGRGIILFHDIHTPALKVVPQLIAENRGKVRWVTIPQIVDELNGVKPVTPEKPKP